MTRPSEVMCVETPRLDARLVMDARGQIREANDAAHRLLHYRVGTLVGLSLAWIMPPSRHTLLRDLIQALKEGARRSLPGVLMRDDSSLIVVIVTTEPCTGPEGQELALSLELDDEPATSIQRRSVRASHTTAAQVGPSDEPLSTGLRSTRPPAPPQLARVPAAAPDSLPASPPVFTRAPSAEAVDVSEQLTACTELLRWLDSQLQQPLSRVTPRDQALARVVVHEAAQLIDVCQDALRSDARPSRG